MNDGTPGREFEVTGQLITALLEDQHPDLAHLEPRLADEGWDNFMFRLGENLAVRLPRRAAMANLIHHEQTWLPGLAAQLQIRVPAPFRVGIPARGYPWHWSVVPWLPGQPADQNDPARNQATVWGKFLRSLHVPAPPAAPINPVRGVPLSQRAHAVEERMGRVSSRTHLITARIRQIWETGLKAPIDAPSTWLHADLHSRNVLVEHGTISGVIDWGDMTSGDCATDLASIWMLFAEPGAHDDVLAAYAQCSEATLQRARAWAVFFGVMLLDTGLKDNPRNAALGERILKTVISTGEHATERLGAPASRRRV
jgi:aminoglycoside phosphotransferase (APT) family kinase protein